ncbi:hypothetical protein HPC50_22085 [Corallococcus exiguus]|uniref:hypothetical protein n=1 Tax=Corallococcus TaxID=83461 RepID=UPI0011C3E8B2|nr:MULTISPECIES: hypothetical protein [Corallococcus]NPC49756.1 hypothetical protein [Corallococcus exiguus]
MSESTTTHAGSPEETKRFHGNAGEFLVLGELLKRKIEAYLALGKTQRDWDIGVILHNRSAPLRVSVKSVDWPQKISTQIRPSAKFDVLVIVLLNGEKPSIFLVIPQRDVSKLLDEKKVDRPGGTRTITVRASYRDPSSKPKNVDKQFTQYEHKWEHIAAHQPETTQRTTTKSHPTKKGA